MKLPVTLALFALAVPSHAQDYPTKPIRLVVPYSPGGPVDIVGRLTALKLTDAFAQQVIVDNRAGGGGNIAVEIVAKAAPDGYTLLMGANGTNAVDPLPEDAKLMVPGLLLANATSSLTEFAGTDGCVTNIIGLEATMPIGARSLAASTASLGYRLGLIALVPLAPISNV